MRKIIELIIVRGNDNSPMVKQVAGFIVAPMWHSIFEEALRGVANENFKAPKAIDQNTKPFIRGFWKGGENYYIDTISGKLATEYTPKETKKEVVVGGVHSILHWIDRNDPTGPSPKTPEDNSQYILWEPIVQKWALQNGYTNENSITAPTQTDDIHLPEFFPIFLMVLLLIFLLLRQCMVQHCLEYS